MKFPLRILLCAWLLIVSAAAGHSRAQPADGAPLRLGVLPNVSVRVLVASYQPMRQYLERLGGRPVEIQAAPDFRAFNSRTLAGEYDLVVTAAHMGRLAQLQAGFVPVAIYQPAIPGLIVMSRARPSAGIEALRGRRLAVSNPQSLVAMEGVRWLRERGLVIERDFGMVHARNEDSLGHLLLATDPDAPFAMLSGGEFRQLPEALRQQLAVFTVFAEVPGFLVLAHPRLGAERVRQIKAQLLQLPGSEEGQRFLDLTGFKGLREPSESELRALDVYVDQTRQLFGAGP